MGDNPVQLAAMAAVALCGALGILLLFRMQPKWAMALWGAAFFFTPIWLGASVMGVYVNALTAMTFLAILAGSVRNLRWSFVDTIMVILFLVLLLAYGLGGSVWGHIQETFLIWFLPYVWGRIVLSRVSIGWVSVVIAVGAVGISLFAIAEFFTGVNPFLSIPGAAASGWGGLQARGGILRAEASFGHSIALGGSLAMSASFILATPWKAWLRSAALIVVGAGTVVTFSRLGIIGFALTLVLGLFFLTAYVSTRFRIGMLSLLGLGAIIAIPTILQVFGDAGEEAEGSANYRADLLPLIDLMIPVGISPRREVLATGQDYWGGFRSIDSALILVGLRYGLVVLAIVVLLLVILIVSVFRRATPASIALVAQIPAFATVALITQYAVFVWFAAGLAVASYTLNSGRTTGARLEERAGTARDVVGAT